MSSIWLHGFLLEVRYNAAIIRDYMRQQIQQRCLQHKACEICFAFTSWEWNTAETIFFCIILATQAYAHIIIFL